MDELKMEDAYIKQPSHFPDNTNVTPSIVKNTDSIYSIDYHTDSDERIATFTGALYTSSKEAKDEIQDFIDGKTVPESEEGAQDLGHGIKGYGEGAAGHAYFSWEEGNWTKSLSSLTKDEMDHPSIAEKMVDYLETHTLPAPKDTGIVYVNYPEGGDSVEVDIRWQEDDIMYQLETHKVPIDALEMTTSVE